MGARRVPAGLALVAGTCAIVWACGGDTESDPGSVCAPGATQTCAGPGACIGAQICRDDGSEWGSCDCGEAAGGSDSGATGGSGGTSAGTGGTDQVCIAGQIQSCLGPGDCAGLRTCNADGSGFEACECGSGGTGGGIILVDGGDTGGTDIGGAGGVGPDPCFGWDPPAWCADGGFQAYGPACGDGELNQDSEECDDGNPLPGDGCSGACRVEPNFACPTAGVACVSLIVCGDGVLSGAEVCDDGNTTGDDGCAADCHGIEPDFYCPTAGEPCVEIVDPCATDNPPPECSPVTGPQPACGDGGLDASEQCDDGNPLPGDGCSGACSMEPNFVCPTAGSPCVSTIVCGDGVLSGAEVCDDGNTASGDGCMADCDGIEPNSVCPTPGQACTSASTVDCGDGVVQTSQGEQCDDSVNDGGWGECAPGCRIGPRCGDGEVQSSFEECDDGLNDGGYGECAPGCVLGPHCGDGIIQTAAGEQCDDGVNDGFTSDCTPGCVLGPHCGDGILQPERGEDCDDGINSGAYGQCGPTCQLAPYCGDAVVQTEFGERCDHGVNAGGYGECAPGCRYGPYCGDGEPQAAYGEQCDEGESGNDGGYGECAPGCVLGPYCGDGALQQPYEECDDGNNVDHDGCRSVCQEEAWVPA